LNIVLGEFSLANEAGTGPQGDVFIDAFLAEHVVARLQDMIFIPAFTVCALKHFLHINVTFKLRSCS